MLAPTFDRELDEKISRINGTMYILFRSVSNRLVNFLTRKFKFSSFIDTLKVLIDVNTLFSFPYRYKLFV